MALSVGILTMHRVRNCGSFLQTYASQYFVEGLGHRCEIIDYVYPNVYHYAKQCSKPEYIEFSTWYDFVKSVLKHRFDAPLMLEVRLFRWLVTHKFHLSKYTYHTPEELQKAQLKYDVVCVGSDQVWNPRFNCLDESFVLSFSNCKKISYASSIGTSILTEEEHKFYQHHLSSFTALSSRELCSANLLTSLLGYPVKTVLDPVFLLSKKEWCKVLHIRPKRNRHVLYCVYNYMADVALDAQNVLRNAIKPNDRVVSLTSLSKNIKHKFYPIVTPRLFVKSIAEASMIITDSFHVTAFAILFEIPVIPILTSKKTDVRIIEMLRMLDITPPYMDSRVLAGQAVVVNGLVKSQLQQLVEQSKLYLKNALES